MRSAMAARTGSGPIGPGFPHCSKPCTLSALRHAKVHPGPGLSSSEDGTLINLPQSARQNHNTPKTAIPPGGKVEIDAGGKPTGVVRADGNVATLAGLERRLPEPSFEK